MDSDRTTFTIGTRKSNLAVLQTEIVRDALQSKWSDYKFDIRTRDVAGDLNTAPLREVTAKNLWTEELEEMLIGKKLDIVVHSLKDVPTQIPDSCTLGAVMKREDPRDVLVTKKNLKPMTLDELPPGSVIGTSSVRRAAQLARHYPHLKVHDVRGSIETRLSKLDAEDSPFTCLILAAAGLLRTGHGPRISQFLDSKSGKMLHAVGQGALGVEIRIDDEKMAHMLREVGDEKTTLACLAERSLLRKLEGGCSAPLGVETEWVQGEGGKEMLRFRAIVTSVDGQEAVEIERDGDVKTKAEAEEFGTNVAQELSDKGAKRILDVIHPHKKW